MSLSGEGRFELIEKVVGRPFVPVDYLLHLSGWPDHGGPQVVGDDHVIVFVWAVVEAKELGDGPHVLVAADSRLPDRKIGRVLVSQISGPVLAQLLGRVVFGVERDAK